MKQANFDRSFTFLAIAAVVIAIIAGFWLLGSPAKQRQIKADQQRLTDIYNIAQSLHQQALDSKNQGNQVNLPSSLSPNIVKNDPISGKSYEYKRIDNNQYQLCAEFATDSASNPLKNSTNSDFWKHPSGRHCFKFNVLEEVVWWR